MKVCSVEECSTKVVARGLCSKHYQRLTKGPEHYKTHGRAYQLKAKFGITPEQYQEMLKAQNGVCAICFQKETRRALSVDHNHITGKVRGLLCDDCNHGIGKLKTDEGTALLFSAIKYIEDTDE
jgi:hypothetical protein